MKSLSLAMSALALLTAACSTQSVVDVEGQEHILSTDAKTQAVALANDTDNIQAWSWMGLLPPYAVYFEGESQTTINVGALSKLNELAEGEMFYATWDKDRADITIAVSPKEEYEEGDKTIGIALAGVPCEIFLKEEHHGKESLVMHELLHCAGYAAADGDVHDKVGIMAPNNGDLVVYGRVPAYLKALWDLRVHGEM